MISPDGVTRSAVAVAALLVSLATVTWRQSRTLEVLAELDEVRWRSATARAEVVELERRIRSLESRARVVSLARDGLGMRMPDASELVILSRSETQ